MAQVKIIAPQTREAEHLRVAAYCRVSSDSKDQLHSYAAQIRSYTEEIAQHDGWELVDVYADEGLTGTRMDRREDFNRMMADCRKGKIDRILVKSVSRFARNTRDCLSALRELSTMGVSVRFEKENIDTKTLTTELMVSVSGSLAQQESISISANQKMSYQRRMERGEFITCTAPYGYRIVNKKDLEIVPEEAATVRWIFDAYLKGRSSGWIAEQLTAKGIPSQSGAECWRETGVRYLLTNEKYIGDALSQKSYSCGFPFVQKRNHGERLQYYTENSHPAIIDRDTFERVQALLQKKAQKEKKRREKSPLALKIVCGNCGTVFQRRSSQNGYVTWVCRTHDRHAADCPVGRIPETEIHAAFLRMYHRLKSNADIILAPALRQLNTLGTILRQNHPQVLAINRAIAEATEESHKISTLRANGLLDADICAARMNAISARLAQLRGERRRLGGGWQDSSKLYLRCEGCGNTAVMDMDATVNGIVRQFRNHEQPSCTAYTPSAEVMRLDNAINRGLEQPDSPEAVMALILQGAAARYACCPEPSAESEPSDSLTEADWRRFQRAVSHITISQDTEVTLIFTDKKATGKDE